MKTLNKVIEDRKAKAKKKKIYKPLSPEGEKLFLEYIAAFEKIGEYVNEIEWPSHKALNETSERVKKLVAEFMKKGNEMNSRSAASKSPSE